MSASAGASDGNRLFENTPLCADDFTEKLEVVVDGMGTSDKLKSSRHICRYVKIPFDTKEVSIRSSVELVINPSHDCLIDTIDTLDLVLRKEDFDNLFFVELQVGGQVFDKLFFGEHYCGFLENTYQRKIEFLTSGKVKVPLHMCCLVKDSFLLVNEFSPHKVSVVLQASHGDAPSTNSVELWGWTKKLENRCCKEFIENGMSLVSQQTKFFGVELIRKGVNAINLTFLHPSYAVFFHFGKDHANIVRGLTRVCLQMDDIVVFDGSYEMLTNTKDYIALYMSGTEGIQNKAKNIWNFSQIDKPVLILEFDGVYSDIPVYIFHHNYQIALYNKDMYSLLYYS